MKGIRINITLWLKKEAWKEEKTKEKAKIKVIDYREKIKERKREMERVKGWYRGRQAWRIELRRYRMKRGGNSE